MLLSSFYQRETNRDNESMADWSNLPNDILELVIRKLDLPDYHRLSAVCKNWRLVAKEISWCPIHQLPWLVLGEDSRTKKRVFFSLSEKKHYYIDIPELSGHICRGSSYGWLFTVDEAISGHVLNPFTRECYNLPPFPKLERNSASIEGLPPAEWQRRVVSKALLSNNPSENQDFTVVVLYGLPPVLAFWKRGSPGWTVLESPLLIRDIVFFKGKLYAVHGSIMLLVVDLGADPKMTQIVPWVEKRKRSYDACLVDFEGEFLLLIQRIQREVEDGHYITKKICISELNLEDEEEYEWEDIGGSVVFVGSSSNVVVDLNGLSGVQPDSVYFTAMNGLNYSDEKYGLDDHGFYDMVNRTKGKYYCPEIFLPRQASPIWFTPNLGKQITQN